ncbi:MAG: DUF2877 domain-containing protein [Casimicrobiaceae bacterium]
MIAIVALGSDASTILCGNTRGEVLAVFRRSFYIRFGDDVVCVGPQGLGPGPLNALCALGDHWTSTAWGIATGAQVSRAGSTLRITRCDPAFDFADAQVWEPPLPPAFSPAALQSGLALLAASTRQRTPGGLGMLLSALPGPFVETSNDPLLCAALPPICAIRTWLGAALAGSGARPPPIESLIGLGPGLTPSGDDFLCGLMTALHYLGHATIAQRLALCTLPAAVRGTNLISAAYLRCASVGHASGVLIDALQSLVGGGDTHLARCLDAVHAVGHTSGWDSLAGAATACAEVSTASHAAARVR